MIQYLRQAGCKRYDLCQVNPAGNPGGYQFKAGLAGRDNPIVRQLGIFEACENPISSVAVRTGSFLLQFCNKLRGARRP
jgi:lipid II:glycine glycyltransferase (peptidoglycan interpeptide bridge formation enzyme)